MSSKLSVSSSLDSVSVSQSLIYSAMFYSVPSRLTAVWYWEIERPVVQQTHRVMTSCGL